MMSLWRCGNPFNFLNHNKKKDPKNNIKKLFIIPCALIREHGKGGVGGKHKRGDDVIFECLVSLKLIHSFMPPIVDTCTISHTINLWYEMIMIRLDVKLWNLKIVWSWYRNDCAINFPVRFKRLRRRQRQRWCYNLKGIFIDVISCCESLAWWHVELTSSFITSTSVKFLLASLTFCNWSQLCDFPSSIALKRFARRLIFSSTHSALTFSCNFVCTTHNILMCEMLVDISRQISSMSVASCMSSLILHCWEAQAIYFISNERDFNINLLRNVYKRYHQAFTQTWTFS